MDPLSATLLAAAVAWGSILLARVVPFERVWGPRGLRIVAGASLANVALYVMGAPLDGWRAWVLPMSAALLVAAARLRLRAA